LGWRAAVGGVAAYSRPPLPHHPRRHSERSEESPKIFRHFVLPKKFSSDICTAKLHSPAESTACTMAIKNSKHNTRKLSNRNVPFFSSPVFSV
jgi:hypothetical protein